MKNGMRNHTSANILKDAVYGIPELYRQKIKETSLIANPGCYPTSIILGLAPALKNTAFRCNYNHC